MKPWHKMHLLLRLRESVLLSEQHPEVRHLEIHCDSMPIIQLLLSTITRKRATRSVLCTTAVSPPVHCASADTSARESPACPLRH